MHKHERVLPTRKRMDEGTKDDWRLPDEFVIRPLVTIDFGKIDLTQTIDNMDNQETEAEGLDDD